MKALVVGPAGVGKTSLLRTLDSAGTLFLDAEAGISPYRTCRSTPYGWTIGRPRAIWHAGSRPESVLSADGLLLASTLRRCWRRFENIAKYDTLFIDSITAVSRLSYRSAEQQPGRSQSAPARKTHVPPMGCMPAK